MTKIGKWCLYDHFFSVLAIAPQARPVPRPSWHRPPVLLWAASAEAVWGNLGCHHWGTRMAMSQNPWTSLWRTAKIIQTSLATYYIILYICVNDIFYKSHVHSPKRIDKNGTIYHHYLTWVLRPIRSWLTGTPPLLWRGWPLKQRSESAREGKLQAWMGKGHIASYIST